MLSRRTDIVLEDIDKRLEDLQIQLLKLDSARADLGKVTDEIYRLHDEKHKAQTDNAIRDELRKRIAEICIFLRKQSTVIKEYE